MTGTRDLTASALTASQASTIHPILLVKLEFDGGDVLFHSELGDIVYNSETYTGVGRLGSISQAEEVSDLSMSQIDLTLSGLPTDLLSTLFNEQYQGRTATIYLGYLNMTTRALIADPTILYKGIMDTHDIDQGATFSIKLSVGSRFAAWNKPNPRRYNNADQQARFPGDTGLQYIEQTTNKTIIWGRER